MEVSADRDFGAWTLRFDAVATRAEVDGGSVAPQLDGLRPAQTPEIAATLGLDWAASERLRVSGQVRHEGQRYEDDLNSRSLAAATTLDFRVAWKTGPDAEVYLAGDNLFDADIEAGISGDGLVTLAAPRMVRIGYSLRR